MFALHSEAPLEEVAQITRDINALEARRVQVAAAYDKSRAWANKYRNAACAIADACQVSEGVARGWLEMARTLEDLPKTTQAFDNGDVSEQKVRAITNAANADRLEQLAGSEDELLAAAQKSTSRQFADKVKAITDRIDGDNGLA